MNEINLTSLDHQDVKQNLIGFLASTGKFDDFDFEGSGINTLIDLLIRNNLYDSYLAHMLANESFIQTAQIRGNVSSQAQKLSYLPSSHRCSRAKIDLRITPEVTTGIPNSIVAPKGTRFVALYDGESYSFTTIEPYTLTLNDSNQYVVENVEVYQGSLTKVRSTHTHGDKITVPNTLADVSTLKVTSDASGAVTSFYRAKTIKDFVKSNNLFFLSEDSAGNYFIEFGKNRLGNEPEDSSVVTIEYVVGEEDFANGANKFSLISTIEGYSNAVIAVSEPANGGMERESIEQIRFSAPRNYETQERALSLTDYATLLNESGYAIKSSKFWPGNGRIYYSAILEDGKVITNTIEEDIANYFEDYYVGSVDVAYVEPIKIGIELENVLKVDFSKTNKTFNQVYSEIQTIINEYNVKELNSFSSYFNESELNSRIKRISGVESIQFNPTISIAFDVNRVFGATYRIDLNNPIKEKSVSMNSFEVDSQGEDHQLYDEDGKVYVRYFKNALPIILEVGSVDYQTGVIQFSVGMIQNQELLTIYAAPADENLYANKNYYLDIVGYSVKEV